MSFTIVQKDITTMEVDAVVNAANSRLLPGGGVCGAIFSAAGYEKLDRACRSIGFCETGSAVITDGFALPARYVIHAVGPIWQGGAQKEAEKLRNCYVRAMQLALQHGCRSMAFPLISSGIYGYPKREALQIAVDTITDFVSHNELEVYLALFDREILRLSRELFPHQFA